MQDGNKIAIVIIPKECSKSVLESITSSGIKQAMSFDARGTAELALLQKLGLGQTKKTLIAYRMNTCCGGDVLNEAMQVHTGHTGIFFTLFLENTTVSEKANHLLVCVIVNAGYAEAVMQEARKAGARGGTIINARGTGKEQDMNFFGIQIVPEKEMLVMVAEKDLAEKLVQTVKALPLLEKPGSGMVFTVEANSFTRLGGNA